MGPPSYMRSVVDRNVVMLRVPVLNGHRLVFRILTLLASCTKDPRQVYSGCYAFPILLSALSMFSFPLLALKENGIPIRLFVNTFKT